MVSTAVAVIVSFATGFLIAPAMPTVVPVISLDIFILLVTTVIADFYSKHSSQSDRVHDAVRFLLSMITHEFENERVGDAIGKSTKWRHEEVGVPGNTVVHTLSALQA